jgi:hypothetical protein
VATIVILEHELQRGVELPYMLYQLAERWKASGHRIVVHHGIEEPPRGDLAILHVDLTVTPQAYRALLPRYARVVNGKVLDVSKSRVSLDLLDRYSDWIGPVIVKTEANFGGRPEQLLRSVAQDRGVASEIPASPVAQGYPVYAALREVPEVAWRTPGLVVERFLPEQDERGYCLRVWSFFGEREISNRWYAREPIVKAENLVERVPVEVPEAMRERRAELGFDFGKFDYVRHGERWVLFDANRTPSFPRVPSKADAAALDGLAQGLELLLR